MPDATGPSTTPPPKPLDFPPLVMAAGVIWVAIGAAIIVSCLLGLLPEIGEMNDTTSESMKLRPLAFVVGGLFQVVVGGFFVYEGICVFRGTIPSTVGIAIGSLLFAAAFVALAIFGPESQQMFQSVLVWLCAGGLLVAGVLALMGLNQYEAWWKIRHRQIGKRPHEG